MNTNLPDTLSEDEQLINSRGAVSDAKLEAMLRKVRGLLAQAEHENTGPAEAQVFRNKAEAMMHRYRIDESMLAMSGGASTSALGPEWSDIIVCAVSSEYRNFYIKLMRDVCVHVGVRYADEWVVKDGGGMNVVFHVVGFPSDLRIVDMLYTSAQLAFSMRLEPKYNPDLSEQENAYLMRKAGMEGKRIAKAIWGAYGTTTRCVDRKSGYQCSKCQEGNPEECWNTKTNESNLYKARRLFKKEALARGEDPSELLGQGNSMEVYRISYANGFVQELYRRLYEMRMSRAEGETGIVLAGRQEAIDEAFYVRYPDRRPPKAVMPGPKSEEDEEDTFMCECGAKVELDAEECPSCGAKLSWSSISRGHTRNAYSDPRDDCAKCQKAKSGYCRDHSYLRPSTARYRETAWNPAGERAGRSAARDVDLGPGGNKSLR